jgi:ubiquinone/menaquinone biosynthesis C-methylase UbiE
MSHTDEYHDAMVALLELVWGEGFMAPGGTGNVDRMMKEIDLRGRDILDIGCGIGGPACYLASEYGARVTGIDLEQPLIERARRLAAKKNVGQYVEFVHVDGNGLPFNDNTFDVVMSSGALTQTEDKPGMYRECYRILRNGGYITCYDWMKTEGVYSDDMQYFFKMEGLTYAMETMERHKELLEQAGFINVTTTDASEWYKNRARVEYEKLKGELYDKTIELIGKEQADHFVENWRALVIVCEKGEMRQGYYRGMKPET